ncbi:MAG: GGDEF domain-containing protein [Candidatus Omnitrophica bacterium]|nr:GGDEF domain-containing protein [Candidatus Omnitrophota bacterium]
MFEENWAYRIIVILSLCILLVWTYLTNEETVLNYISGKFIMDTRLVWQIGIFALLSIVLFYLMQSTLDYKSQNDVLKKYLQRLQHELDTEREALKDLKQETNDEVMRLESFVITISDMAKQISSVLETDELLRVILRKAIDLLNSQKCAIFKMDHKTKELIYVDSIGYKKKILEGLKLKADEESGLIGYAASTGLFASKKSMDQDYTKSHILDKDKMQTSFSQPIVHNSSTIAVICVGDASKDLTHEQVMRLLSTLANFGAVALTNTNLVDKLREQSIRDSLTWLYNHQHFQERMNKLLDAAARENEPLGFIMLDIDHFKQLNDTHGHQAGDFVLKNTAKILSSELRGYDIVARYGGEEFVAILPRRNLKQSYDIAERLRSVFEKGRIAFETKNLNITISAGVSAYDPTKKEKAEKGLLIKYADNALYEAKKKGRNQVIMAKT